LKKKNQTYSDLSATHFLSRC